MKKLYLLFVIVFASSSILLFGCSKSENKRESSNIKKETKIHTRDYVFDKSINTDLGNFIYLKSKDSSNSGFAILKMNKSEFDVDKIQEFAENKGAFKDSINTTLKVAFDDSTGLEISRGDGGDSELNSKITISYSKLTSEYIDFFRKYKNLSDSNRIYKIPYDEITFLEDNKNYEFLFYENGIFITDESHFPVKKGSILEPLID